MKDFHERISGYFDTKYVSGAVIYAADDGWKSGKMWEISGAWTKNRLGVV